MRLVIGTAQFGLDYGVSNRGGKVEISEVQQILAKAKKVGIHTLDTAIIYGDSESILGIAGVEDWRVITKLPAIPLDVSNVSNWIREQIQGSGRRLNLTKVDTVLLHRPEQILEDRGQEILNALRGIKKDNLVNKIGISIYSPSELEHFDLINYFDIVQAPLNILDRNLIESNWLNKLKKLNIEVHVRSIFLQGLLLMKTNDRPLKFSKYSNIWNEWDRWLVENDLTPLEACLAFINSTVGIDGVIVGVENSHQLDEIISASNLVLKNLPNWPKSIPSNLLNPSLWSTL